MKTSVILATYNGELFILKQLKSLLKQTRKADEVIIVDDFSMDNTFEIILEFIKREKLKNWHCYKHNKNLGIFDTFKEGLDLTSGEIIFFCDQDDIWLPTKIELMSSLMENNFDVLTLRGKCNIIDENDKIITNWPHTGELIRLTDENYINWLGGGNTIAIRSKLKFVYNNITKEENLAHDFICGITAFLFNAYYLFDDQVIMWRRHSNNASVFEIKKIDKRKFCFKFNWSNLGDSEWLYEKIGCNGIEKYIAVIVKIMNDDYTKNSFGNYNFSKEKFEKYLEFDILQKKCFSEKSFNLWFKSFKYCKLKSFFRSQMICFFICLRLDKVIRHIKGGL